MEGLDVYIISHKHFCTILKDVHVYNKRKIYKNHK